MLTAVTIRRLVLLRLWQQICLANGADCIHMEPCKDALPVEHMAAAECDNWLT